MTQKIVNFVLIFLLSLVAFYGATIAQLDPNFDDPFRMASDTNGPQVFLPLVRNYTGTDSDTDDSDPDEDAETVPEDEQSDTEETPETSFQAFGDPNSSHIGSTVLRRPVREAPDNIYTDSGIVTTDEFGPFTKKMEVYGLTLIAREGMSDEFITQVAVTMKEMFAQTEETDRSLQEAVLKNMYRYYTVLPVVTEAESGNIGDVGGMEEKVSVADIIMSDVEGQVNEVVEHLLHAVTSVGMHYALNDAFGLHEASSITQAMREAQQLGLYNYDSEGISDEDLDKVLVQEYVYWVIITGWNIRSKYAGAGGEWNIQNASELQAQQPSAYDLFESYIPTIMSVPSEATLNQFVVEN